MTFLIILLAIACIALGLFVLIQNPKGGGLATGNAGSSMFGVQRTGDVLEKGTWILIAVIVALSLAITAMAKSNGGATAESKIKNRVEKTVTPAPIGNKPAATTTDTTKTKP